jgi:hypothetical protein
MLGASTAVGGAPASAPDDLTGFDDRAVDEIGHAVDVVHARRQQAWCVEWCQAADPE